MISYVGLVADILDTVPGTTVVSPLFDVPAGSFLVLITDGSIVTVDASVCDNIEPGYKIFSHFAAIKDVQDSQSNDWGMAWNGQNFPSNNLGDFGINPACLVTHLLTTGDTITVTTDPSDPTSLPFVGKILCYSGLVANPVVGSARVYDYWNLSFNGVDLPGNWIALPLSADWFYAGHVPYCNQYVGYYDYAYYSGTPGFVPPTPTAPCSCGVGEANSLSIPNSAAGTLVVGFGSWDASTVKAAYCGAGTSSPSSDGSAPGGGPPPFLPAPTYGAASDDGTLCDPLSQGWSDLGHLTKNTLQVRFDHLMRDGAGWPDSPLYYDVLYGGGTLYVGWVHGTNGFAGGGVDVPVPYVGPYRSGFTVVEAWQNPPAGAFADFRSTRYNKRPLLVHT